MDMELDSLPKPRPFVKWAGGKSRLAPKIASFFPEYYNDYYEPFLGSGAVYFEIAPQRGILNDLNANLIEVYKSIKQNPRGLIREMKLIEKEYNSLKTLEEKAEYYYGIREEYNHNKIDRLKKAGFFVFLNKAGWNGMYRENSLGYYNIPFGKKENLKLFDEQNIISVSRNIQKMKFTTLDYKDAVKSANKGDLIYFDPPYFPLSKTASFTDYQKKGFSEQDQKELHGLAVDLVKRGCYVVVSNSNCRKTLDLYKDFEIKKIIVSRTIGAKVATRGKIEEIVALGYRK